MFNSFMSNMTSFLLSEKRYIYVVGGFDSENTDMLKLSLNTMKWEQVCKMNAPRSKFGCVASNDNKNIVILGGKKGKERVADT